MATPTTVTYSLDTPAAVARPNVTVTAQLVGAGDRSDQAGVVGGLHTVTTDEAGEFALQLLPNSAYHQAGTYYAVNITGGGPSYDIVVPPAGPVDLFEIRIDTSTLQPIPVSAPSIYLTRAERGAAGGVASLGVDGLVPADQLPESSGGVPASRTISTGGLLTGGGDLTANRTITSPVYGTTAGTITQGDDPRLSDDRDPLPHTHPIDDVDGLEAALGGKEVAGTAASAMGAHLADADPHPQYLTETDADALYDEVGAGTTAAAAAVAAHVGAANPHAQYANASATTASLALKAPLESPAFTGTPTGITKTHVGLGNVDNSSDSGKPVSTATQTALNGKATKIVKRAAYVTSGNINLSTGGAAWGALPLFPTLAIPAVAGDWIELEANILRQANANLVADLGVITTGPVIKRWLGNGATSTPGGTYEGDVALYHTNLPTRTGPRGFTAAAGDIEGGNVTFALLCKVNGAGSALILADAVNPFYWQATNFGAVG